MTLIVKSGEIISSIEYNKLKEGKAIRPKIAVGINVDTIPNSSDIEGISNNYLEILKPMKFALLSGLDNNITKKLDLV